METLGLFCSGQRQRPGADWNQAKTGVNAVAQPISLELPHRDPRIALQTRLHDAPIEHAEAVLAAYEVLQGLHDRGILEVMRGALDSGDRLLDIAVRAAEGRQSIRGIRNLLLLINMLGAIEPEVLKV